MKFLSKSLFPFFLLPALFQIEGAGFLSVILSGAKDLASKMGHPSLFFLFRNGTKTGNTSIFLNRYPK